MNTFRLKGCNRAGSTHSSADGLYRIRGKCHREACSCQTEKDSFCNHVPVSALHARPVSSTENDTGSHWLKGYSSQQLRDLQMKDNVISTVLSWKETTDVPAKGLDLPHPHDVQTVCMQWCQLSVIDGVLHREFLSTARAVHPIFQIVLPAVLRREMY